MERNEYEKGRAWAMGFGAVVYIGVVLAASTLFITFVLTAFPVDAYFSRFVMGLSGFLVGLSMLAFPVALHLWAVEKWHRIVTTALYYVEMGIISLNTVVAFMNLLATYTEFQTPGWALAYEPLAVGSIVYTLAAWGTVFLLDPMHRMKNKNHEAQQKFMQRVAEKEVEYLDSIEGENAVMAAANAKIEQTYDVARFRTGRKHFGGGIPADPKMPIIPAEETQRTYNAEAPGSGEVFPG